MKRFIIIGLTVAAVIALFFGTLPTMADKPQKSGSGKDVIALSNGFPSGPHETLNIHGKKADYQCVECVPCATCEPPVQCNVVNIPEYTTEDVTISYVSGRKVKISELTVFDSCAGFDPPNEEDGAEVWLPYHEAGYLVYARALGKPAKGDPNDPLYEPRSIIFKNAENDNPIVYSLFGEVTEPGDIPLMLPLGLITKDGAYELMSTEDGQIFLERFDSEPADRGRGKTLGKEITDMFMWSGWVFHWSLDLNGDEAVDELDVEYNCWSSYDTNGNGIIDYDPDILAIGDANGDTFTNRYDLAFVAPCTYDLDNNGEIDATEFDNWLTLNEQGWVFPPSLDLNGDGAVNELDVEYDCWSAYDTNGNGIIDYNPDILAIGDANGDTFTDRLDLAFVAPCAYDLNNDGVIDPWDGSYNEADEFENWLEDKIPGDQTESDFYITLWVYYETPVWVFTIADLVYNNQLISNQGIKNLQIRFYPIDEVEITSLP